MKNGDERKPADLRAVAAGFLEKQDHAVTPARDGREPVELYNTALCDLVLMDVQMPLLHGFAATVGQPPRLFPI